MPPSKKRHNNKAATRRLPVPAGLPRQADPERALTAACPPSPCIALPPAGGLEALHITLQPGAEFRIDFGLAYGQVVLRYPLEGDPQLSVYPSPEGAPAHFEFHRLPAVAALLGEMGREAG
jgi:hypothetical protein